MEELFEVNLAVAVVVQAQHDLDQIVAVDVDLDVGQSFLKSNF